jgi:hypothetical protein
MRINKKYDFINELTPSNKIAICCLAWVTAFAPAIYLNSSSVAFGTLLVLNIWLLSIMLYNSYLAIQSIFFIEVPIKNISAEIDDVGSLEQRKIQLTVRYEYEINSYVFKSYRIRYPFWFVADKPKIYFSKKINSNSINFCYVNPKNHKQAVLIRGFELADIPWFIIYIAFVLACFLTFLIKNEIYFF